MKLSIFAVNEPSTTILWFYNDSTGERIGYEYYSCNDQPVFYSRAYSTSNGLTGIEVLRTLKMYNI